MRILSQFISVLLLAISSAVVVITELDIVIDFEPIKQSAHSGAALKYLECYGAFGLLVTVVWLHNSILRLLSTFPATPAEG